MVAGVLVLLDVGPPIFFWQERIGWKRRSFLIYKFRTLVSPFDAVGKSQAGQQSTAKHDRAHAADQPPR